MDEALMRQLMPSRLDYFKSGYEYLSRMQALLADTDNTKLLEGVDVIQRGAKRKKAKEKMANTAPATATAVTEEEPSQKRQKTNKEAGGK